MIDFPLSFCGYFASVAKSRVYGHGSFLPDRGSEKELPEVVPEDVDAFDVGPALGLPYHLCADGRLDESFE